MLGYLSIQNLIQFEVSQYFMYFKISLDRNTDGAIMQILLKDEEF